MTPLLLALLVGCKPPPEAPSELNDLSRYMYRVWAEEDERALAAGVRNLEVFLADVDLQSSNTDDRGWQIEALEADDVASLPARPDRPLENLVGVGLAFHSCWPARDHARLQTEADQLPAEPTATRYVRTFPEEADPACFPGGSCDVLYTLNDARRANFLFAADFELHKSFRWVTYEDEAGEPRDVFYSRSWFERSWPGDKGNVTLSQSHSLDVWIDRRDGSTWRYQVLWSETEGLPAGPDAVRATVTPATNKAFQAQDQAVADLFHEGADCAPETEVQ